MKELGPGKYVGLPASAYRENKFYIFDDRKKQILNYKIKKNNEIELKLIKDKVLLAGTFVKTDRKSNIHIYYTSCIYDLKNNKYNYLLPLSYCNDFNGGDLYKKSVAEKSPISINS